MSEYKCHTCGKDSKFGFQPEKDGPITEYCEECFVKEHPDMAKALAKNREKKQT